MSFRHGGKLAAQQSHQPRLAAVAALGAVGLHPRQGKRIKPRRMQAQAALTRPGGSTGAFLRWNVRAVNMHGQYVATAQQGRVA